MIGSDFDNQMAIISCTPFDLGITRELSFKILPMLL
jgi:hypothetical protein